MRQIKLIPFKQGNRVSTILESRPKPDLNVLIPFKQGNGVSQTTVILNT